jgi:hypothetical protein
MADRNDSPDPMDGEHSDHGRRGFLVKLAGAAAAVTALVTGKASAAAAYVVGCCSLVFSNPKTFSYYFSNCTCNPRYTWNCQNATAACICAECYCKNYSAYNCNPV